MTFFFYCLLLVAMGWLCFACGYTVGRHYPRD